MDIIVFDGSNSSAEIAPYDRRRRSKKHFEILGCGMDSRHISVQPISYICAIRPLGLWREILMNFDEALGQLESLKDLLLKSKAADEEKNVKISELTQKVDELNNSISQKETEHKQELDNLSSTIKSKDEEINALNTKLEEELKSKDEEINALNTKLEEELKEKDMAAKKEIEAKKEYESIQEQLKKISSMYQEAVAKQDEAIDVRELLSIYIILLEEVFQGRPHAKILFLLHGDKDELSRQEINKASGFQPAAVLKSIHDLANANLVKHNEEQDTVGLVRKLY
jgi:DNA repair exonuclease SbcCD ATPase subunit